MSDSDLIHIGNCHYDKTIKINHTQYKILMKKDFVQGKTIKIYTVSLSERYLPIVQISKIV